MMSDKPVININNPVSSGNPARNKSEKLNFYFSGIPVLILFIAVLGFFDNSVKESKVFHSKNIQETKSGMIKNSGKVNLLSSDDLLEGIKDTVYTDKDNWLELRIDQQMLYQHWRDGRTEKYPISSGNNKGGDPEALESRPGLFAIFQKEEFHQSTQFNSANMYHFMPFNQGIGFHSIDGTGYYAHLGVRPSSHGCIRMKHQDAEKLYKETPMGTLVLASRGFSARVIAFAPKDFENDKEYEKDEYKYMLSNNLYNIASGRYFLEERKKFIINPKIIPVSGVYSGYDLTLPKKQLIPRSFTVFYSVEDRLKPNTNVDILAEENSDDFIKLISNGEIDDSVDINRNVLYSTNDLIKKYFNNPIGVLPYFGPKK